MGKKDSRVDSYIAKSTTFAQPVLHHIRALVHKACPDVEEKMKWSFPHFDYKGMMCSMAAFKQHCAFGFWKASVMSDPDKILKPAGTDAMGHFGRITGVQDLPSDKIMIKYIRVAAALNDHDVKVERRKPVAKGPLRVPAELVSALKKNKFANETYLNFPPSQKREYIEWLTEAKTDATRAKRLATAIEWMAEGKIRNWKYVRK